MVNFPSFWHLSVDEGGDTQEKIITVGLWNNTEILKQ